MCKDVFITNDRLFMQENDFAFWHNSCKKVAQLGKVIVSLTDAQLDREIEIQNMRLFYENEIISPIFTRHNYEVERIKKKYVPFRKQCIESATKFYSPLFKQLKTDYKQILSDYASKISKIKEEISTIKNDIQAISIDVTPINSDATNAINALKNPIEVQAQPLPDPTSFLQESDIRMKTFVSKSENTKKQLHLELSTMKTSVYAQRKNIFILLKDSVISLKNEITSLQGRVQEIQNHHQQFVLDFIKKREFLISNLKQTLKQIHKQYEQLSQYTDPTFIQTKKHLIDQKSKKAIQHRNQIDSINKQIQSAKTKTSHLQLSFAEEHKRQVAALNSIKRENKAKLAQEIQRKKEEHDSCVKKVRLLSKDFSHLKTWLYAINEKHSISNLKMPIPLPPETSIDELEDVISSQEIQLKKVKQEHQAIIKKLQAASTQSQKMHEKVIAKKAALIGRELDDKTQYFREREIQRRNELSDLFKKKEREYNTALKQANEEYSADIAAKEAELRLYIAQSGRRETPSQTATNALQQKVQQYKSMLAFITKEIEAKKKALPLLTELINAEREKRMTAIRIENERSQINEKYQREMPIKTKKAIQKGETNPQVEDYTLIAARNVLEQEKREFENAKTKLLQDMENARIEFEKQIQKPKLETATTDGITSKRGHQSIPQEPSVVIFKEIKVDTSLFQKRLKRCQDSLEKLLQKAQKSTAIPIDPIFSSTEAIKLVTTALLLSKDASDSEDRILKLMHK